MPRHINPDSANRKATAPYNFVPLPNKILTVEEGFEVNGKKKKLWELHDQYVPGTKSGWIDLTIKTLTPLFIRGPVKKSGNEWELRESRLRPEPYTNKDGIPIIPGSSLRGMIRSLVEILSFSKVTPVTDEKQFFRTVANDRIGDTYRNRLIRHGNKPHGGYARKNGNQWVIVPVQEVFRVHRNKLNELGFNVCEQPSPKYYPDWDGQQHDCWFKCKVENCWEVESVSIQEKTGWRKGVLVLTGSAPNKKYDFLFCGEDNSRSIAIPENIFRQFHDDDQITQWQERAFPKDKPFKGSRDGAGFLRNGEPVFYLTDDAERKSGNPGGLVFFGRAQMFRLPYDLSPSDLIPDELKVADLDMAEAMFGRVLQNKGHDKYSCIKGRVFVENATADKDKQDWYEPLMVPRTLSAPKITCFQHYLTQDGRKGKELLTTYLNGDYTTIRGSKVYWHRWDEREGVEAIKEPKKHNDLLRELMSDQVDEIADKQHTVIRPVKSGVIFHGRIRFMNLADIELGALLTALNLPEGSAHKIGMGKPLGLGSIRINSKLCLLDCRKRYECWGYAGVNDFEGVDFMRLFEDAMMTHAINTQENKDNNRSGLMAIGRMQALYHMLAFDLVKNIYSETAYMKKDDFRDRPVLPTPHCVSGQAEPLWQYDPPCSVQDKDNCLCLVNHDAISRDIVKKKQKPIGKGQILHGQLIKKNNVWIVLFDGDNREGCVINAGEISGGVANGAKAEFLIMQENVRKGILKARYIKAIEQER